MHEEKGLRKEKESTHAFLAKCLKPISFSLLLLILLDLACDPSPLGEVEGAFSVARSCASFALSYSPASSNEPLICSMRRDSSRGD